MPTVTILVPTYQERDFIRECIESVKAFDDPTEALVEIFIVDGMSSDGTREIVRDLARADRRIRLIDNPRRVQSAALNIGIGMAAGELVMRLDAHSHYPANYLALALSTAERADADNVGGVLETLPRNESYEASLVQALTTHRFGVGNSGFRTGATEGKADTVPYGCFRRDVFQRVGLFDERLVRAQDYEMNRRIQAAGGVVWLNPAMRASYFNQPDIKSFLRKQALSEAPYNAYMWYLAPYSFAFRHAVTAVFALGVIVGTLTPWLSPPVGRLFLLALATYALLAISASVQQAYRYRRPIHALTGPACFFLYHLLHGAGVLYGLLRLALGNAPVQRVREPWAGAGRFRAWPPPPPQQAPREGVAA